jgi:hypothetical protein
MPNGYGTLMLPHLVSQPGIPTVGAGAAAPAADDVSSSSSAAATAAESKMGV